MKITKHAIHRFCAQMPDTYDKTDEGNVVAQILDFWEKGVVQNSEQYGFATKFQKYDFEVLQNTEHRRFKNIVMTKVDDTIVTVHFKTETENTADRRRKQKQKRGKKGRSGYVPWYNRH